MLGRLEMLHFAGSRGPGIFGDCCNVGADIADMPLLAMSTSFDLTTSEIASFSF
jgi:hypothetical protein